MPEDLADLALAFHAEIPDRTGCPSLQILRELATRSRPIDDPWYGHLHSCSNCYRQVRASQHVLWPGPSFCRPHDPLSRDTTGSRDQL